MELCETALVSMKVASVDQAELLRREEALTLEAAERARDLERLETRERLVTQAEDDVAARKARAIAEVDRGVATTRLNLEHEFEERLGFIRVEAEGRTAALRAKLEEETRWANASWASLDVAQEELTTSRAEALLLRQRADEAEAVVRQNEDEIRQRRILEHEHGPMLARLRERANAALGNICEVAVSQPHAVNYAGNL